MASGRPNLFSYATKELSQDAMICWLIAWSAVDACDEEERRLRDCGCEFVKALLGKHGRQLAGPIRSACLHQQDHNIDVLALVEDRKRQHVLLIEDKTHTGERSDAKLKGYLADVQEGHTKVGDMAGKDLCPIYLKTGNQSRAADRRIEDSGYGVFRRADFLEVLETYRGNHPLLCDFRAHLRHWEADFLSFRDWERGGKAEWSWAAWEGFFVECEKTDHLRRPEWSYVAQKDGGFLAFTWGSSRLTDGEEAYLQLETVPRRPKRTRLCFRIGNWHVSGADARNDRLHFWNRYLLRRSRTLRRPGRLRTGESMTVAWYDPEWMAFDKNGAVDVTRTASNLKMAQEILDEAVALKDILEGLRRKEWWARAERRLDCDYGRLGFHVRGTWTTEGWNPGVFVGVLLDGEDHGIELRDPERGDACVLLCLDESLHGSASAEGACEALVEHLRHADLPEPWRVCEGKNRWHPVHVLCPLGEMFVDNAPIEDKAQRFYTDAHQVVKAVLAHLDQRTPWG